MRWKRPAKLMALAVVGALSVASSNTPWHATVEVSDRAHTVGNPEAETKLTEFVSYTCPHCAEFAIKGDPPLQLAYIGTGKLKLEVRPVIRNSVDLVATMLVQCGDASKFPRNHTMFMLSQRGWLPITQRASQAQVARWTASDKAAARRAIANDLGFYGLMEARGYSRVDSDKCLNDQSQADRLEANTDADSAEFDVHSTPSFAIDGKLLKDVHEWTSLETALNSQLQEPK